MFRYGPTVSVIDQVANGGNLGLRGGHGGFLRADIAGCTSRSCRAMTSRCFGLEAAVEQTFIARRRLR